MPSGVRKIQLGSEEHIVVLDVGRDVILSQIVSQYLIHCNGTKDDDFKPLSLSSLFVILEKRAARMRKSAAGLDNSWCDNSTAFD